MIEKRFRKSNNKIFMAFCVLYEYKLRECANYILRNKSKCLWSSYWTKVYSLKYENTTKYIFHRTLKHYPKNIHLLPY